VCSSDLIGGAAAAAHTGAVPNDDAAIEAFCASCGIVRVKSLRRLLLAGKAFGRFPQGLGRRALILSNSGGPGVLCADRAALEGLELGALPQAMANVLRQQLPPEASIANPIDLLADAREDRFGLTFEAAMTHAAQAYDMVLMIHVVPFMVDAAPVIARLAELAAMAKLPVMHSMMGTLPDRASWFAEMERAGVPMFNDVEEMAEAAGLLARYPDLRSAANRDSLPTAFFRDRSVQ
jgi:acetyltransferase